MNTISTKTEWTEIPGIGKWLNEIFKSSKPSGRLFATPEPLLGGDGKYYTHVAIARSLLHSESTGLAENVGFYFCRRPEKWEVSDNFVVAALLGDKPLIVLQCSERRDSRGALIEPVSSSEFVLNQWRQGINFVPDAEFKQLVAALIDKKGAPLSEEHPLSKDQLISEVDNVVERD